MNLTKLIFSASLVFAGLSATAQDIAVPFQKKSFVCKTTASWCTPCGHYGYIGDSIKTYHSDSIVYLNMHVGSSSIGDAHSGDFHDALNTGGIPNWNANGTDVILWPPDFDTIMTESRSIHDSPITANVSFQSSIVGDSLVINTSAKFFENVEGTYYLTSFIYEDDISYQQKFEDPNDNSQSIYMPHHDNRISRGSITLDQFDNNIFGAKIRDGEVEAGAVNNYTFKKKINSSWDENNLGAMVVLWQQVNDSTYTVISAEDVQGVLGLDQVQFKPTTISVYPNPSTDVITVNTHFTSKYLVTVFDINGKIVLSQYSNNSVDISHLKAGQYTIQVQFEHQIELSKFIKQ